MLFATARDVCFGVYIISLYTPTICANRTQIRKGRLGAFTHGLECLHDKYWSGPAGGRQVATAAGDSAARANPLNQSTCTTMPGRQAGGASPALVQSEGEKRGCPISAFRREEKEGSKYISGRGRWLHGQQEN